MKVLQFMCSNNQVCEALKQIMTDQINIWSRLQRLSDDPDYFTEQFDISIWKENSINLGVWWINYDSIYSNLGDDGQKIADQMFGDGNLQGILLTMPLVPYYPESKLHIVDVIDLISSGYLS
jgi:hypothetical protein